MIFYKYRGSESKMKKTLFLTILILSFFFLLASSAKADCVVNGQKAETTEECCSKCRDVKSKVCVACPPESDKGIDFNKLKEALTTVAPSIRPEFLPGPTTNIGTIISTILPYLFVIAGLLLLFYLIYGGFHMMIAANDEKGLAEAKGKITNALIGFLLLFISYWLVQILGYILGIKIF